MRELGVFNGNFQIRNRGIVIDKLDDAVRMRDGMSKTEIQRQFAFLYDFSVCIFHFPERSMKRREKRRKNGLC